MKTKHLVLVLALVLSLSTCPFSSNAQTIKPNTDEIRITIEVENQPLIFIFRYLMTYYDIPIGFEQSVIDKGKADYDFDTNLSGTLHNIRDANDIDRQLLEAERRNVSNRRTFSICVENGNVAQVFDQLVSQMEHYKWEINDGVVNIIPIEGRDARFKALLELEINRFQLNRNQTVRDITSSIRSLNVFNRFLRQNNLEFFGQRNGATFVLEARYGRALGEDIDFSQLTLRELLNRTTKIKRGGWILKWDRTSKQTGADVIDIDI